MAKKQARLATRLIGGLHGEAWRTVQDLITETDKLKEKDGYKSVLQRLQSMEKEGVVRLTEAFDQHFERTPGGRKANPSTIT